jgi:tRNA-(ms[2]io[6]A)-hydroxylase
LLNDHANCELKAASTALSFIYRYPERTVLCDRMSRLAREELRHFEQVRRLMGELSIPFRKLSASRYAGAMRASVRAREPDRLLDALLVGALIEARSCERFAVVAPLVPHKLGDFYRGLLASEARHFENYLALAESETGAQRADIDARLEVLLSEEASLITSPDAQFRFHSGVPAEAGRDADTLP